MVSVDELIIRCGEWQTGPPPGVDYGAPGAISVGSLLRREGRAPHAFDRPLQPRGHSRPPVEPPEPPRRNVRKATAAAGALFAAGAMFATAVVENVVLTPDEGVRLGIGGDSPGPDGRAGGEAQGNRGAAPRNVAFSIAELAGPPAAVAGTGRPSLASPDGGFGVLGALDTGGATAPSRFDPSSGAGNLVPQQVGGPALAPGPDAPTPGAPVDSTGPGALPGTGIAIGPITLPVGGGAEGTPGTPVVVVPVPDLDTPGVGIPGVEVPGGGAVPDVPGGAVRTPQIGVSPAQVRTPDLTVAARNGDVAIAVSDTALVTPDVTVTEVQAGPARLSPTEVGLPDVTVTEGGATLSGDRAQVAVPGVAVSESTLVTPDVQLGRARVALPDETLPELTVPELAVDTSDPGGTVEDAASGVVSTVDQVGTDVVDEATDVLDETVGSVGETLGSLTGFGRSEGSAGSEGSAEGSGRSADADTNDADSRDSGTRDSDSDSSDSDSDSSDSAGSDSGDSDSGGSDSTGSALDRALGQE